MLRLQRFVKMDAAAHSSAKRFFSGTLPDVKNVVIVGGVAGGATAAARIHRLDNRNVNVTIVERGADVSFANCGLPYYLGREIKDPKKLELHTPQSLHETSGARILINTEAKKINRDARTVTCHSSASGTTSELPYDRLILSPGAQPILPPVQGLKEIAAQGPKGNVFVLRTLDDMRWIDERSGKSKSCVIIGGGFIGLEVCEQLRHVGKDVTLLEGAPHVLPPMDLDFSRVVECSLTNHNVALHLNTMATAIRQTGGGTGTGGQQLEITVKNSKTGETSTVTTDFVVVAAGVRPESNIAKDAGLELSQRGHIVVNDFMQTNDPAIYAVGDVVETRDGVFPDRRAAIPLGNLANQQARICADHAVTGQSIPYPGSIGTAIVRVFDQIATCTGWNEQRLADAGIKFDTASVTSNDHAGYYPGAVPISAKIHYCPDTGKIYGGQVVGPESVDRRCDILAVAVMAHMTVDQLSMLQLAYSPPFGSARDIINTLALHARNKRMGLVKAVPSMDRLPKDVQLVDCRVPEQANKSPIPGAINIPFTQAEKLVKNLDKKKNYGMLCPWGRTAYFTTRTMQQEGFENAQMVSGGITVHMPCNL